MKSKKTSPAAPKEEPTTSAPQTRRIVSARRRIMAYLLLLFGIYLCLCAGIAWDTVRPKQFKHDQTPGKSKLPFDSVRFVSKDGTNLSGWFIPSPKPNAPRGVIVLCHGVDSTRTAMLWKAKVLNKHGYATLLFDFRGRGESGPSICTLGYRETDDLLAAIHYVQSRPDCRDVPLGVFGESQGGAVALMGTARAPQVRAVVSESPFAQLDHAVHNHFASLMGLATPVIEYPVRAMGELIIRRRCCNVSPVQEITRIAPRPILLIQDADDVLCPPAETRALLKAAGSNAQLWTVPNAGHIEAESVEPEEFEKRVVAFYDASL